jgi:hypothetical protein
MLLPNLTPAVGGGSNIFRETQDMQIRRTVLAVLAVTICAACAVRAQPGRGQWVLLGQRAVTDRADHDTIVVTGAKGNFTAVKFEVRRHAVDFHRVVIHFGNGDDQNVELRNTIRAGGESRVIDINGIDRVIRSIDFWYDAKTLGRGGSATVRVLGRH